MKVVPSSVCIRVQEFLKASASQPGYEGSHDLTLSEEFARNINCGPKQTSTVYYKRDYVVDMPHTSVSRDTPVRKSLPAEHTPREDFHRQLSDGAKPMKNSEVCSSKVCVVCVTSL